MLNQANPYNPYNPKIPINDHKGTKVAYSYNGVVYAIPGQNVGTLRGGNIYGLDGQLLGRLTPRGVVVCEDGSVSETFLRLAAG